MCPGMTELLESSHISREQFLSIIDRLDRPKANVDQIMQIFRSYDEGHKGYLIVGDLLRDAPGWRKTSIVDVFIRMDEARTGRVYPDVFVRSFVSDS